MAAWDGFLLCFNLVAARLKRCIKVIFRLISSALPAVRKLCSIEAKLDKHNNVVERVYKLEKDQAVLDEKQEVANHRIKDLEGLSAQ